MKVCVVDAAVEFLTYSQHRTAIQNIKFLKKLKPQKNL